MGQIGRTALKVYFETGKVPTEAQFIDLIDSLFNTTDDNSDDLTEGSTKLLLTAGERTAIPLNTAKTGITTQQASDITTNNAKTGITTQQATDITTNNAKTGITSQQATDITANNAKETNVPADDTAYNESTWNANTDSATKNAIRDKVVTMDATAAALAVSGGGATQAPSTTLDLTNSISTITLTGNLTVSAVSNAAVGASFRTYIHNGYTLSVMGVSGFTDYGNGEYEVKIINKGTVGTPVIRVFDEVGSSTSSYNVTAAAVFARQTNRTTTEKAAFNTLIASQSSAEGGNGNWELLDEFYDGNQINAADALIGCKSKTATINGSVSKVSGGWSFTGGRIETDFVPSTDGVNWDVDDALYGLHIQVAALDAIAKATGVLTNDIMKLTQSAGSLYASIQGGNKELTPAAYVDDTIYSIGRYSSGWFKFYVDGVMTDQESSSSTGDVTEEIWIGDGYYDDPYDGEISSYWIGAEVGFDHASWNTALEAYRTALSL